MIAGMMMCQQEQRRGRISHAEWQARCVELERLLFERYVLF